MRATYLEFYTIDFSLYFELLVFGLSFLKEGAMLF